MVEQAAREILGIVAHQDKRGNWEGDDHNCGTDAEIVGQAIEVLKRHFGTTISSLTADSITTVTNLTSIPQGWNLAAEPFSIVPMDDAIEVLA